MIAVKYQHVRLIKSSGRNFRIMDNKYHKKINVTNFFVIPIINDTSIMNINNRNVFSRIKMPYLTAEIMIIKFINIL